MRSFGPNRTGVICAAQDDTPLEPWNLAELADHFVNRPHFIRHLLKLIEREGLRAVRKRFLRFTVHFDHQAIGSDSNAGAGERCDHVGDVHGR